MSSAGGAQYHLSVKMDSVEGESHDTTDAKELTEESRDHLKAEALDAESSRDESHDDPVAKERRDDLKAEALDAEDSIHLSLKMDSVGDESHGTVAKESNEECHDLNSEVIDAESSTHLSKTDSVEGESHDTTLAKESNEERRDLNAEVLDAPEGSIHLSKTDSVEGESHDTAVAKESTEECRDLKAEIHEPEGHEPSVVDQLAQKFSAVMGAGIVEDNPDNNKVDSVVETAPSDAPVSPAVAKRKLPEVKRFSARRSVGAENNDPKTMVQNDVDEPTAAPSTIRRQRGGAQRGLSTRMHTGIDDRDTVDYAAEGPNRVVETATAAVITEVPLSMTPTMPKQQLSVAERERLRLLSIKRNKDIVCLERVRGRLVNITQGLELHTGVFSRVEQNKVVDLVRELQMKGRRQELRDKTYSEPRKWMRGKGRVTLQFGCCYNYAVDKYGNPPGILREDVVDPIPPLLRTAIKRLVRWHVLPASCVPDSCIINMYEEGDCIPPHIDHHDFLRPFCTLSLVSECSIVFGANLEILGPGDFGGNLSLPLPVGSVLVLNGNGADVAKHAVPAVPTQRISITFRKMDPSKVPVGFTLDEELQNLKPVMLPS